MSAIQEALQEVETDCSGENVLKVRERTQTKPGVRRPDQHSTADSSGRP